MTTPPSPEEHVANEVNDKVKQYVESLEAQTASLRQEIEELKRWEKAARVNANNAAECHRVSDNRRIDIIMLTKEIEGLRKRLTP
jgi:predicted RNase H-like nuclease (RuvC/YqgF family)